MATQDKENKNESSQEVVQQASAQASDPENKKNKFPGFNLYVKNLDDSFTDSTLREAFDEFGTITSAKVMCDSGGNSRGFGFVCFTTQEEANKALTKMNGRIVGTKPLYVGMAQRKEERKQYLSDKYKNYTLNTTTLPVSPPAPTQQPPISVAQSPSPVQYLPNNAAVPGSVQYRYLPQDSLQWQTPGSPYVIHPVQAGVGNAPVTLMSYQPLFLVPGVGMMAQAPPPPPPPPMPILHQPIYIHNTKTNTLIYSTSVQAHSSLPQVPSPGIYGQVGNEMAPIPVPAPYQEVPSPQASPHFKTAGINVQHYEPAPTSNNADDVIQQNGNVLMKTGAMQIPGNPALQFQTHSNNNFAT